LLPLAAKKNASVLPTLAFFIGKAPIQSTESPISLRQIRQSGLQLKHAVAQERQVRP
jgi:hypothetical protein